MNKTELIEKVAAEHSISKAEVGRVLDSILSTIVEQVTLGDQVTLPGFGSFKQAERAARTGVNPSTSEKIEIAASKAPKFTAGATFKAAVNGKK